MNLPPFTSQTAEYRDGRWIIGTVYYGPETAPPKDTGRVVELEAGTEPDYEAESQEVNDDLSLTRERRRPVAD